MFVDVDPIGSYGAFNDRIKFGGIEGMCFNTQKMIFSYWYNNISAVTTFIFTFFVEKYEKCDTNAIWGHLIL